MIPVKKRNANIFIAMYHEKLRMCAQLMGLVYVADILHDALIVANGLRTHFHSFSCLPFRSLPLF